MHFVVLGIKPRALGMLGKYSISEHTSSNAGVLDV